MFSSKLYAWDSQAMVLLSRASWSRQGHHDGKSFSEVEITELQHPLGLVDSGQHFAVRNLCLNEYSYGEVMLVVDQIADPPHVFSNVYAAQCSSLLQSVRGHQFNYTHEIMTVTFRSFVNPDGATLSEAFGKYAWR